VSQVCLSRRCFFFFRKHPCRLVTLLKPDGFSEIYETIFQKYRSALFGPRLVKCENKKFLKAGVVNEAM